MSETYFFATEIITIVVLIFHQLLNSQAPFSKGTALFLSQNAKMGEHFNINMYSHLFEVAKRILLLMKIIRLGDYYAHWNFWIPFSHIFMCVGIFIFQSNIFIFFVELFYSYTNNSFGVSAKNQFPSTRRFRQTRVQITNVHNPYRHDPLCQF